MASDTHVIHDSMEKVAARSEGLCAVVYERFFKLHPEAQALFGADVGHVTKGNMLC